MEFLTDDICGMLRHHSLLQREILEASVYFGLSSAVSEARRLFQQWMAGNLQLPADIRDIVYSTGKEKLNGREYMDQIHLFFFPMERYQIWRLDRMGLLLAALQGNKSARGTLELPQVSGGLK